MPPLLLTTLPSPSLQGTLEALLQGEREGGARNVTLQGRLEG